MIYGSFLKNYLFLPYMTAFSNGFVDSLPPHNAKTPLGFGTIEKNLYLCTRNYCKQAGFPKNYILPRLAESGSAFF